MPSSWIRVCGTSVIVLAVGAGVASAQSATQAAGQPPAQAGSQPQGQAAAPPPQVPVVKEHVEVVATRLPETPHEVPAAIEVIGGDRLRAMGATTLRDVLALAAGVEVAPGGDAGPAGSVPEFWGLREFDAFLLVVDGIPWGGAFNPAIRSLNLRDVERVEILRGSAPVTFGATSFVGVIHVVHREGADRGGAVAVHGGSFGSGGGSVEVSLTPNGAWKTRLGVDVDRQGFSDDRTSFLRGHATFRGAKTAAKSRSWFTTDIDWLTQDPASPHPREGRVLSTSVQVDSNYNPARAFLDDARFSAAYGTEREIGGGAKWSVTGSFSHSSQRIFRGFLTDISNTANNATGYRENIDVNDVYVDSHIAWPERAHIRFVVGADLLFGSGEGRGATFTYTAPLAAALAPAVPEPATLGLDTGARRTFGGVYALAEYTPLPKLTLSAGARLNVTGERHGEGATTTNTRPSGSLGAIVGIWEQGVDHVRLYANYRNTFKPAAFDFSLAENEGVLKPETAQSWEGGLKARMFSGRLDLEASAFHMDFENLVTSTVVGGLPALINAGKNRFQGYEVAADFRPIGNLTARASYSFHDGRFVDFVMAFDGVPQQLGGKRFEMSARHLFSGGLVYSQEKGIVASAVVKYTGDRYLNKRNSALAAPFTVIDAGVGYRLSRWEFRVDGRNLTNRRDAIAESELGDAQYYLMPARRIEASVGLRF